MAMKIALSAALLLASGAPATQAQAQAPGVAAEIGPVTGEYYYRIKWGSAEEFKRLYERNHAPIMREMQKQGFITKMEVEEPFTHLAGGPRWDLRVTVTYREAASAILVGGTFDKAFAAATARLYPNKAAFQAEEQRRFSLLEEHWDMIVVPVGD
jgi:hypothetical protein